MITPLLQAERSLVGAAILDPAVFAEAALQYSHFSDAYCQVAWKALGNLVKRDSSIDEIAVADESGNKVTAAQCMQFTMGLGVVNTQYWTGLVRDGFMQRSVKEISSDFAKWSNSSMTGEEMLSKVKEKVELLESANARTLPTLAETSLSLPFFVGMTQEQVRIVAGWLCEFFERGKAGNGEG